MLALDRPLGVVADLALFGDHADRNRVFYVPTRPRIAASSSGQPELVFVKFRPEEAEQGGVGLLSFTTELVADDAQLGKAKDYLVRQGVSEPHLVQVPWVGGKAVFAAALEQGDGFVEQLLGEITPDLAATNRALFSARLNEDGARLVEALVGMEGPSPLGVRYELEYDGLRPALDVRIRADYKRIYQELSWGFQFGVAYEGIGVRASVESATQKLLEAGAIEIDVLQFTDDASLRARVDDAIRWIEDRILEDFFKTSLQPAKQENLLDKAIAAAIKLGAATLQDALKDASLVTKIAEELGIPVDALKRLGQAASSGGGGSAGKASESTFALKLQFTFRDIHQEELKTITLDWREAHAERRTAAPQGLLSRIGGAPHIVEAEDVGAFWDTLDVNVRPLGDFAALGVQRLVVQLAYPDETAPDKQNALTFEQGETGPKKFSAWTNGKPPRYRGRTEVHFDTEGAWPGPPVFIGEWKTLQSLELAVHPLTGVPKLEVEISPGTLKFAETPQAQVDLRLDGNIVATRMLSEAKPTATFRLRLESGESPVADVPALEARTTWFFDGGRRVEGDWIPVEGTTLLVHSPWRGSRKLRVLPMLPDDFIEALVTLTLIEGNRSESVEVSFAPGERRAKAASISSLSEDPPPVKVDALVIRGDSSSFVGTPFTTSDPVVLIRDRDGAQRQVSVRLLAGPTLSGHGLIAVQVQLLDAKGDTVDNVVFTESRRDPGLLLVPVAQDPPPRYRVIRYKLDGSAMEDVSVEVPTDSAEVLIPAVVKP